MFLKSLFGLWCVNDFSISATTTVKVLSVFISHLTAALSASKLSALDEARVPICAHHAIVESRAVDVTHAGFSVFASVIFDETKAARSLKCFLVVYNFVNSQFSYILPS